MQTLHTARLVLEPLTVSHAAAMHPVLSQAELYRHLDYGPPPSLAHVRQVYEKLEKRASPDGREAWLNWVVCLPGHGPIGFVQATVVSPTVAWVAYLLSQAHWGQGHASAATQAMIEHLAQAHGTQEFLATVEKDNARSIALLERLLFARVSAEGAAVHELTATEWLFKRTAAA